MKVLEDRITVLTQENKRLHAQVETLRRFKDTKPIASVPKLQTTIDYAHKVGFRAGKLHIVEKLKSVIESLEFGYEVKYGLFCDTARSVETIV